jgi:hypothetical protein
MAANNQVDYIYMGVDGEVVPRNSTHVTVDKSVKVIPAWAFFEHQNIEEFECHDESKQSKNVHSRNVLF